MFQSLMTIIMELYLYLTKVIFMLKHSVKIRRDIYIYIYIYIYICWCVNYVDFKMHGATIKKLILPCKFFFFAENYKL